MDDVTERTLYYWEPNVFYNPDYSYRIGRWRTKLYQNLRPTIWDTSPEDIFGALQITVGGASALLGGIFIWSSPFGLLTIPSISLITGGASLINEGIENISGN